MKTILLHGDNSIRGYERLQELIEVAKKRGWNVIKVDSNNKLTLPEVFTVDSLFNEERLYVIENLNKLNKKDLDWLKKNAEKIPGTLIIYHHSLLTDSKAKALPKLSKKEEYKLPKQIFKFLESFYPGNAEKSIELLHQVIKEDEPEFVFNLLSRHLRDLQMIKMDLKSLAYPSWRLSKLSKQAKLFQEKQIIDLIELLAEVDVRVKSSKETILDSLDFIIAAELE